MFTQTENQENHVLIKGGDFMLQGKDEAFNTIEFDEISGLRLAETENGAMYCLKLVREGEVPAILWVSGRFFCDFSRRVLNPDNKELLKNDEPLNANFALKPIYKEGRSSVLCLYALKPKSGLDRPEFELLKVMSREAMEKQGVPSWEDAGKYKDSSKQEKYFFGELVKIFGTY